MPKQIPYEKKKIHIPTWVIREDHKREIKRISERDKTKQSHQIQEAIRGFIQKHTG